MSKKDTEITYSLERNGFNLRDAKKIEGQNAVRIFCPKCHADRSRQNQRERELYVNLDNGCCHCHNCGADWRIDSDQYLDRKNKAVHLAKQPTSFTRPKQPAPPNPQKPFSDEVLRYLTQIRRLSMSTITQLGITEQIEKMPKSGKQERCIAFNYWEQGELINQKFRTIGKEFKATTGAESIAYNIDSILGETSVIITEGEFDTAALVEAGFKSVISIPTGANGNTDWMNRFFDLYFADKNQVYIATDSDAPGVKAAEELSRRFGPEICLRVKFGDDCKDANDVLVKHGVEALRQCIEQAEPYPMPDIKTVESFEEELDALFENGPVPGVKTGWTNLDKVVSFGTGQLALVTGRSNDGKSEWLDELVLRLLLQSGWNASYWTPENTLIDHSRKLIEKLTDQPIHSAVAHRSGLSVEQYRQCKQWLRRRLSWIDLPFDQLNLDNLLCHARSMVRKYGIKVLVLDPFNFIEKENNATRSENAWDSHVVGAIRSFAIKNDVLVFLVAHPRKVEMQIDGRRRRITMEDISGTADFGNKADYCFCVDRDDEHHVVTISIDKVRRKQYGSKGKQVHFVYRAHSGRYCPCEVDEEKNPVNTDITSASGTWIMQRDLFDVSWD